MPDAARAQPVQAGEQPRDLVGRQAGGRLVEHQDCRLRRQRPGDRHQRFLGAAERCMRVSGSMSAPSASSARAARARAAFQSTIPKRRG